MIPNVFVIVALFFFSHFAQAAEISAGSAFYSTSKNKADGEDNGGSTKIDAAGRYADKLEGQMDYVFQGGIELNSYSAPSGGKAPDNNTGILLGGGVKINFDPLSDRFQPYALAIGSYKNLKGVSFSGAGGYTETEISGLFYGANAGLRMKLDSDFFIDLEAELFESALMGVKKTSGKDAAGKDTVETEETTTELHGDGSGSFSDVAIYFGMYL